MVSTKGFSGSKFGNSGFGAGFAKPAAAEAQPAEVAEAAAVEAAETQPEAEPEDVAIDAEAAGEQTQVDAPPVPAPAPTTKPAPTAKPAPTPAPVAIARPSKPALVVVGDTQVDLAAYGFDTVGDFDLLNENDAMAALGLSIPVFQIAQGTNIPEGQTEGLWTNKLTGEQESTLHVVPAIATFHRTLRAKYDAGAEQQKPPICRSLDGKTGSGSARYDEDFAGKGKKYGIEPGRNCESCPMNKWMRDDEGKNTKPCSDEHIRIVHSREWGPGVITFRGTAVKPLRTFSSALYPKLQAMRGKAHAIGAPVNLVAEFALGSEKAAKSWIPTFGRVECITGDAERLESVIRDASMLAMLRDQVASEEFAMADVEPEGETVTQAPGDTSFDPDEF